MLQTVTVHVGDKVTDSKSSLNHSVLDLQTSSLLSCTISEKERCGIVTFSVRGIHSQEVRRRLAEERINVTVSLEEFSHLDLGERDIKHLVRASVHYYNSEEEVDRLCNVLAAQWRS